MKNKIFILFLSFCFSACETTKIYEFLVENQLNDKTVKIIPKSKTNFWITSNESYNYIVLPGEKIVIGSKIDDAIKKKAPDIYKSNEVIARFDVYIDDIKQEKPLSLRKYWEFSVGRVNASGKYTLIINENILKD